MIQVFDVLDMNPVDDGMGGFEEVSEVFGELKGYLDLSTGSNRNFAPEPAIKEESTHVLIVPSYRDDLHDRMLIRDQTGRKYRITHIDDPVGVNHHLEIYLKQGD